MRRTDVEPALEPPPGNPRFPLVDSLRAVAALCVLLAHSTAVAAGPGILERNGTAVAKLGVCVFFLISGFLLYRPFVAAWRDGGEGPRLSEYARRRVLRIVPAYWVALAAVVLLFEVGVTSSNWWAFPAFGQIYRETTFDLGIAPAWTLCVEVTFYAALPLVVLAASHLSRTRGSLLPHVLVLSGLAAASLAFHGFFVASENPTPASTLPGTFYWFALGMGLALVSVAAARPGRAETAARFVARRPGACWVLAAAAFAGLCAAGRPSGFHSGTLPEHIAIGLVALLILTPAVLGERGGGLPRRVMAWRPLAWLGLVSYSLYLCHLQLMVAIRNGGGWLPEHYPAFLTVALIGAVALAACGYYLVERPVLSLKRGRVSAASGSAVAAAGVGLLALIALAAPSPSATCPVLEREQQERCHAPALRGHTYALEEGGIRSSVGKRIATVPGSVTAFVDDARVRGDELRVSGWAASERHARPADALLFFAEGRFLGSVKPSNRRVDVAGSLPGRPENIGFDVAVPRSEVTERGRPLQLQIFAVEGGRASQLGIDCERDPRQYGC